MFVSTNNIQGLFVWMEWILGIPIIQVKIEEIREKIQKSQGPIILHSSSLQ